MAKSGSSQRQQSTTVAAPIDTKDNLRSRDKFEVILGLGHGPIKGPTRGLKSIKLDGTQFQAEDGSLNFPDANIVFYPGNTPGETIRPMLGGFEDWRGYNVGMAQGVPVSFTTQSLTANQIILRFKVKRLFRRIRQSTFGYEVDGTGPNTIRMEVLSLSSTPGTWENHFNGEVQVTGRTTTDEVHEVRIQMSEGSAGPHTIQITPLTADTTEEPCQFELEGYYEVEEGRYGLTKSSTVSVTLSPSTPVIRTTEAPPQRTGGGYGIDMIDIRLVVQQLLEQRDPVGTPGDPGYDPGGTFEDEIELLIEVRRNSYPDLWRNPFGGMVKVRGKTTSPAVYEFRVLVPAVEDRWDIRVTRVSGELEKHIRVITWESFQEIIGGPMRFDGVTCLGVQGRATAAFSSYPEISGEFDLKLIKVPTNYDPIARTYSGVWDGNFKIEWSNNPAWCLYDLAMDDIYGARRFWPDLEMDRSDAYEAGIWCDQMVPDGRGGWQPRYTMNLEIKEARGIKEQLRYMAGAFNSIIVDDYNGSLRLLVDKDDEATAVFGPENVFDGTFTYSYTDPDTRYNEIVVKFASAERDYETDSRRIFDGSHQADYGVIPYDFAAVGCTDQHEAVRRAAYKLLTATTETETVSFSTNRRGLFVSPFDVILISDPDKGHGITGRIAALENNRTLVRLSTPIYLESGVAYDMRVDCASGVVAIPLISTISSYVLAFEVAVPIPLDAPDFAVFTLGSSVASSGTPKPYRVMRVDEAEGSPDNVTIEALEINRNKWPLSDAAIDRAGLDFIGYGPTVASPTNLQVVTETVLVNAEPRALAVVTWTPSTDPRVNLYAVDYRRAGTETWIRAGTTRSPRFEIFDVPDGDFDVRVGSQFGTLPVAWTLAANQAMGLTAPPADVASLSVSVLGDAVTLAWPAVPDRDLSHYYIKHTPVTGPSANWGTAVDLIAQVVGTSVRVPILPGTFLIKAVDTSGVESRNATTGTTSATGIGMNAAWASDLHPTWVGTKVNCAVDTDLLKSTPGVEGTYTFESIDLGRAYLCRLNLEMVGSGERPDANMIFWERLSDLESISNVSPADYTFSVEMQISEDGSTWGDWRAFAVGDYVGQVFRWRVHLIPRNPLVSAVLLSLRATVDMPDRVLSGRNVAVSSSGLTISFDPTFRELPSIGITGKNFATGDYFEVTSETTGGFFLLIRNNAGTAVSRTIDWIAVGYGYGSI